MVSQALPPLALQSVGILDKTPVLAASFRLSSPGVVSSSGRLDLTCSGLKRRRSPSQRRVAELCRDRNLRIVSARLHLLNPVSSGSRSGPLPSCRGLISAMHACCMQDTGLAGLVHLRSGSSIAGQAQGASRAAQVEQRRGRHTALPRLQTQPMSTTMGAMGAMGARKSRDTPAANHQFSLHRPKSTAQRCILIYRQRVLI
jgi:hypothetical protein